MKKKVVIKKKSKIDYLPIDIVLDQGELFVAGDLLGEEMDVKCECGSEKTYGKNATHVDWCPKHKIT